MKANIWIIASILGAFLLSSFAALYFRSNPEAPLIKAPPGNRQIEQHMPIRRGTVEREKENVRERTQGPIESVDPSTCVEAEESPAEKLKHIQDATGKFIVQLFGVFPKLMRAVKHMQPLQDAEPQDRSMDEERRTKTDDWGSARTASVSDHVAADLTTMGLTESQLSMIEEVFVNPALRGNAKLQALAKATDMPIDRHLIYRYLTAVDWAGTYHGTKFPDAITETINWRDSFRISQIRREEIQSLVRRGFSYTASNYDKKGRSIIYVKFGRNTVQESDEMYLKLMLYTVER
jgi:hypothetical protein